jgi:ABC-type Zn uptake system ZnuABC Zn-binding protein ZnuA
MSHREIKGMMNVNNEVGSVWKEAVVTFYSVLSKPVPEETKKYTKNSNQFEEKSSRNLQTMKKATRL